MRGNFMNYSFFSRVRDILFLCALIFLVKFAFERTISFISEHKKSIVHELDRTFIEDIYTLQRQLHFIEEHYAYDNEVGHAISDIKKRLAMIEEKYKTNSPGIMLLGPIGSAAIVTKEEKLKTKLLEIANDITQLLYTIHHQEHDFKPIETISTTLEHNKKLLKTITV